jgi:hypothetical protein
MKHLLVVLTDTDFLRFYIKHNDMTILKTPLKVQGDQDVSVHLMITVQKTRKNILNSFN